MEAKMWRKKSISLIVLITFFLFYHFVWANPEGQSLSYQIGPLLNKTIQTSGEKAELIKVIVVMNRDHLKPLSENLINELKNRIERLGGHIGDHAFNNVQVWIPIDKVEELAKWGEIKSIRTPIKPQINGINSEGKDVIGATSWHNSGLTGKGVKLGVIDLGFSGYSSLLGSELPSDTQAFYTGSTSDFYSTEHGTACAEIAYDIAPDAEFCLINVADYEVDFHNAVSSLKSQNVNVISSSIGINLKTYCALLYEAQRTSSLGYISSQINALENCKDQWNSTINSAINQGLTWSQAAGNDGTKKWTDYFNDSDGDHYLNFTSNENYNEIELSNFEYGEEVYVIMMWGFDNEGYTYDDYDLYITNNYGNIVDYSDIDQSEFPVGWETCKFIPLHGIRYFVRVLQYRATSQKIGLLLGASKFPNFKHFTSGGTVRLFTPASNPNVITVGAVAYNNPCAIEPYSSQGTTVEGIIKPDLVATDGVSTSSYGWHSFYGTSAAAPHVAGACALVKQAYPTWSPSQIKNYLEQNAQDLGVLGKDNVYGSGLIQLGSLSSSDAKVFLSNGNYLSYNDSLTLKGFGQPDLALSGDFNGDGKDDLLWYETWTGLAKVFLSDGNYLSYSDSLTLKGFGQPDLALSGDFNGDGKDDLLWYETWTTNAKVFLSDGNYLSYSDSLTLKGFGQPDLALSGDFNGDGKDDLLWYETWTGVAKVFLSDGNYLSYSDSLTLKGFGQPDLALSGDFNGDGMDDVMWYENW
jgi:subtilisin family serine protease